MSAVKIIDCRLGVKVSDAIDPTQITLAIEEELESFIRVMESRHPNVTFEFSQWRPTPSRGGVR